MADESDSTAGEAGDRVMEALENSMVACGAGFLAAFGRYTGMTSDSIKTVFLGMLAEVDELIEKAEKAGPEEPRPVLRLVENDTPNPTGETK